MRLERLSAAHEVGSFSSGHDDLDRWLRESALGSDAKGVARVYVHTDGEGAVDAFIAVSPHVVRRIDLPPSVGRGSPEHIPGYLIGKLALAKTRQGTGVGGELLVAALGVVVDAAAAAGGRIVVDAIDENARQFYSHHGFTALAENPDRLYLKVSTALKALADN